MAKCENWNECLRTAFGFCLIDRWFEFEFDMNSSTSWKNHHRSAASASVVAKQISIPKIERPSYVTIYDYLMTTRHFLANLNFSLSDESSEEEEEEEENNTVVNDTIAPTQTQDDDDEDSLLILSLKSICL